MAESIDRIGERERERERERGIILLIADGYSSGVVDI